MKIYVGERTENGVHISVVQLQLPPKITFTKSLDIRSSLEIINHSPTGFEWGYAGSGPAQLALAILLDCVGIRHAQRLYMSFKFDFIARLLQDQEWAITETSIKLWVDSKLAVNK